MKELKFVVKLNDKTYNSWAFVDKEIKEVTGKYSFFGEQECFESIEEASLFIKDVLYTPRINRWRPEVDETWFEIVPVYFSKDFKRYVTKEILEEENK